MAPEKGVKEKNMVVGYYSAISASYDSLHGGEQAKKLRVIREFISPGKDDLLLDVGCGTCLSFSFFGCPVKGVEPSREMVLMHPNGGAFLGRDVFIGGAEDLKKFFGDGSFDFVVCVTAAHHFNDSRKAFGNMLDMGSDDCIFAFSLLRGSGNFDLAVRLINDLFEVINIKGAHRDSVFFCRKKQNKKFK